MTHAPSKLVAAVVAAVTVASCASNRLRDYEYAGRSLGAASVIPYRPDVLSGPLIIQRTGDPIRDIVRAGSQVAREVEAQRVRERLDSAAVLVDVGHVLEDRTLERAARYLGARPVGADDERDFELELSVLEYGIDAEAWEATAYFFIEADAALIDIRSGQEIWRAEVGARDPIGPEIYGRGRAVRQVVTAAMLGDLSEEEIANAMESLADFSARVITDRLRDDLRAARRRP